MIFTTTNFNSIGNKKHKIPKTKQNERETEIEKKENNNK